MGAYRSAPEITKDSDYAKNTYCEVGCSSMCGWRLSQEDAHFVHLTPEVSIFAVWDGHGGKDVSLFAKDHLLEVCKDFTLSANAPVEVYKEIVFALDERIDKSEIEAKEQGCTSVIVFVYPLKNGKFSVTVVNSGDSRAAASVRQAKPLTSNEISNHLKEIIRRKLDCNFFKAELRKTGISSIEADKLMNNYFEHITNLNNSNRQNEPNIYNPESKPLTQEEIITQMTKDIVESNAIEEHHILYTVDHKPKNQIEQERILKAGGFVQNDRVNGDLALSRALGDFRYKDSEIERSEQVVTAEPDVYTWTLSYGDFLILACDGIWDVYSSDEVLKYVKERILKENRRIDKACEELMDHSLAEDCNKAMGIGTDNMTVVAIRFEDFNNVSPIKEEEPELKSAVEQENEPQAQPEFKEPE